MCAIENFGTENFRRIEPFIVTTHDDCSISTGCLSSFVGGKEISTPSVSLSSIAVEAVFQSIQYLKTVCAPDQSLFRQTKDIEKVLPSIAPWSEVAAGKLSNWSHCRSTSAPFCPSIETPTALAPPLITGLLSKCRSKIHRAL